MYFFGGGEAAMAVSVASSSSAARAQASLSQASGETFGCWCVRLPSSLGKREGGREELVEGEGESLRSTWEVMDESGEGSKRAVMGRTRAEFEAEPYVE